MSTLFSDLEEELDELRELASLIREHTPVLRRIIDLAAAKAQPIPGGSGHAFDVSTVLGIGPPNPDPLPAPEAEHEIVLRIPDGLTLLSLRDSAIGRALMHQQDWYEKYDWCRQALPAGIYHLRIPVSGSFGKSFAEQQALLPEGEQPAPVVLVAAALLCLQKSGQPDRLQKKWTRCAEPTAVGNRAGLTWFVGRLDVIDDWGGGRFDGVGLSSLRTSS
jgi:hypothetical protein